MSITQALKWSFFSEFSTKVSQPIVFIILARFLTPDDFGVMTAALIVTAFSQIFWDAGMAKTLIQRQTDVNEAADIAFLINLLMGFFISISLFWLARPIADTLFHDNRVVVVLQVMTLQILFGAFSSVHAALLQKDMAFKKLFWVRLITVGLPGFASIFLAWLGAGYWALVIGSLAGSLIQVIMLWVMNRWRPGFTFNRITAVSMGRFGAWVSFTGMLSWLLVWVDSIIVAKYFGVFELGLYKTGSQVATIFFLMVFPPLMPVLYSHLSKRTTQDFKASSEIMNKVVLFSIWVAMPIAAFIFWFSGNLETIFFDKKWVGIGSILGILAIREGFAWVTANNGEFYRAANKPQYESAILLFSIFIYIPVYIYFAQISLEALMYSRIFAVLLTMIAHFWLLSIAGSLNFIRTLIYILITFTVFMASFGIINYFVIKLTDNNLLQFILACFGCGLIYFVSLMAVERNGIIKDIKRIILSKRFPQ
jgi:PST family polysaccharide transporter